MQGMTIVAQPAVPADWLKRYEFRPMDVIRREGLTKVLLPAFNAGTMEDLNHYRVFFQEVVEFGPGAIARLPAAKYKLLVYLAELGHIHHGYAVHH
jgi:hypothetical protein